MAVVVSWAALLATLDELVIWLRPSCGVFALDSRLEYSTRRQSAIWVPATILDVSRAYESVASSACCSLVTAARKICAKPYDASIATPFGRPIGGMPGPRGKKKQSPSLLFCSVHLVVSVI